VERTISPSPTSYVERVQRDEHLDQVLPRPDASRAGQRHGRDPVGEDEPVDEAHDVELGPGDIGVGTKASGGATGTSVTASPEMNRHSRSMSCAVLNTPPMGGRRSA
jgi:hypothetical protein